MVKVVARLTPNTIVFFFGYICAIVVLYDVLYDCAYILDGKANTELYFLISLMYKAHMYRFPSGTRSGFNVGKLYCKS
jgi:hypothetical protein